MQLSFLKRIAPSLLALLLLFPLTGGFAEGNNVTFCEDHDCLMSRGMELLISRNASEAQKTFRTASKNKATGKDPVKKDNAKRMQRKAKDFYSIIFSDQTKINSLSGNRSYLEAYLLAQSTLGKARSCAQDKVDICTSFDEELVSDLTEQTTKINEDRVAAIEEAIEEGTIMMGERNFATASTSFNFARGLCLAAEPSQYNLDDLIREADYGAAFVRGERLLDQENCEQAHVAFEEAAAIMDKNEVRVQIDEAARCAYSKLLELGMDQLGTDCDASEASFIKALSYQPNDADANTGLVNARKCRAGTLLTRSRESYTSGDYKLAATQLKEARALDPSAIDGEEQKSISALTTDFYDGVLAKANAKVRAKQFVAAGDLYLAAGGFKESVLMGNKAAFCTAYQQAQDKQNKASALKSTTDLTALRDAWATAKRAAEKAQITGTNVNDRYTKAGKAVGFAQKGDRLWNAYVAGGRKNSSQRAQAVLQYRKIPIACALKTNRRN